MTFETSRGCLSQSMLHAECTTNHRHEVSTRPRFYHALLSDVTELTWFSLWWTDQWANRASPLVIGWRICQSRTPLDSAYCIALLHVHCSVRQKLNQVRSVQFSYIPQYMPLHSEKILSGRVSQYWPALVVGQRDALRRHLEVNYGSCR